MLFLRKIISVIFLNRPNIQNFLVINDFFNFLVIDFLNFEQIHQLHNRQQSALNFSLDIQIGKEELLELISFLIYVSIYYKFYCIKPCILVQNGLEYTVLIDFIFLTELENDW